MNIINYFDGAISYLFVHIHSFFLHIRFPRVRKFSINTESQRVDLDISSLYSQVPESAIPFFNSYESPIFKLFICSNACISSLGIVSSKGLVLPYNLPAENRAQSTLLASAYKKMLSREAPSVFTKGSYVLFYNPFSYSNIAHWLTESLVRLWLCKDLLTINDTLIIPYSSMTTFAIDSIRTLGIKNDYMIHDSPNMNFQELKVIHSTGRQSEFHLSIREMSKTILGNMSSTLVSSEIFTVLYIKRHAQSRRRILNEEELFETLQSQFKLKIIDPSCLSFNQQVQEFNSTKCVISLHGAALSHLIWMKEGSHVIELYKDLNSYLGNIYEPPKSPSSWYTRLSTIMNLNYHLFQCFSPNSKSTNAPSSSLVVDCAKLKKLLIKISSNY